MYHVRVTTSLLADAATHCGVKLYIHGAAWDTINTPMLPATVPGMALVLVLELDPSEIEPKDLEVVLVDEDGEPQGVSVVGRIGIQDLSKLVVNMPIRQPLALSFPAVTFQRAGKHRFILKVNGEEIHSTELLVNLTTG
jgi:hypothetical protein